MIETDEFQRLVSDMIRLPIGPLLPPILAEKQIVWLRKEIAQLARHRQMVINLRVFFFTNYYIDQLFFRLTKKLSLNSNVPVRCYVGQANLSANVDCISKVDYVA